MNVQDNETPEFEFGIYSLGELIPGPSGRTTSASKRIEDIMAAAKLADEAGLDIFGIGEHHRLDFVTSSYAMILAAIAQATKRIRLTSTLSVISTADPVRRTSRRLILFLADVLKSSLGVEPFWSRLSYSELI